MGNKAGFASYVAIATVSLNSLTRHSVVGIGQEPSAYVTDYYFPSVLFSAIMIHWVTAHDHVGSHTHSSWKPDAGPLNSGSSRGSRGQSVGAMWPEQDRKRPSFKNRVMFWQDRSRETIENYNNADSWLHQQRVLNEEAQGAAAAASAAAQRARRRDSEDICDDAIMVDLEAGGQATNDGLATDQQQQDGASRPEAVSNAHTDETRYMENLRPLPLVCRRTGMSPSI